MQTSSQKESFESKPFSLADFVKNVPPILASERAQYSRLQMVGSGSYGKCFVVVQQTTKERLACKILSCAIIKDEDYKKSVKNEINFHSRLRHKHIVQFVESFSDQQHIYIVQKLCSNGTLLELQLQRKYLDLSECRYVVYQILMGTEYIHKKGIIHRDLKLANILIDGDMQMKICDFGLATLEADAISEAHIVMGTTNYLAPEVINRQGFKRRSDIWAIGVIAFVLLYGYKPFEGDDETTTHHRISKADYRLSAHADKDLKSLFRNVFEMNVEYRSNASECLTFNFFKMHTIPPSLPIKPSLETSTATPMDISMRSSCILNAPRPDKVNAVDYPVVRVRAKSTILHLMQAEKHINVMLTVFCRFNAICGSHSIKSDASVSNLAHSPDHEPAYWITRWSYDLEKGFAYQLSDDSIGMFFPDGFHLMRTPDEFDWSVRSGGKLKLIPVRRGSAKSYLEKFCDFEERLLKNGSYDVETAHDRLKLPHLITWFQTDEAMVMCLSNDSVQMNFCKSHKKVIICPHNETITFVSKKICRANFKTVPFDTVAECGFSMHDFIMFKYITAALKQLMSLLEMGGHGPALDTHK